MSNGEPCDEKKWYILLCQHKAGVCIDDAVSAGGAKGRASRRSPRHEHTEHKQHSTQRCGQFFHLVFSIEAYSARPYRTGKASNSVYHILSRLKSHSDVVLQQNRLQLPPGQRSVQCSGQTGKVRLQAAGLGNGVILPVGHKVVMLALEKPGDVLP